MSFKAELEHLKRIAEEIHQNHLNGLIPTELIPTVAKRFISAYKTMPGYHNFDAEVAKEYPGKTGADLLTELIEEKLFAEAA